MFRAFRTVGLVKPDSVCASLTIRFNLWVVDVPNYRLGKPTAQVRAYRLNLELSPHKTRAHTKCLASFLFHIVRACPALFKCCPKLVYERGRSLHSLRIDFAELLLQIINSDNVQEAARETDGYFIKSGIVTVIKDALIPSGTIIWKLKPFVTYTCSMCSFFFYLQPSGTGDQ